MVCAQRGTDVCAGFQNVAFGQINWTGVLSSSCVKNTNFQLPTAEPAKKPHPVFSSV